MVLQQVPAPQFFCCDQIVVLDQCRGSAVQEISAALHDLCREPGDEQALFLDVLCLTERAMLFLGTDNPTAQLALCVGQPSFLPAVITRIGHNLAIRVGIDILAVQVDANLCLWVRAGFYERVNGNKLELRKVEVPTIVTDGNSYQSYSLCILQIYNDDNESRVIS